MKSREITVYILDTLIDIIVFIMFMFVRICFVTPRVMLTPICATHLSGTYNTLVAVRKISPGMLYTLLYKGAAAWIQASQYENTFM